MRGAKAFKPLGLALAFGAAAWQSAASASTPVSDFFLALDCRQNAVDILARGMQPRFTVNVLAILLQRDSASEGCYQHVKVERDVAGRSRCQILQPLKLQGVTTVDDGERVKLYLPDKKLIIDQDSPAKQPDEVVQRIDLAKRNYSFRLEASGPIAGRSTWCVVATPKHEDLETRKYFLDKATYFPLRLETSDEDGEATIVFDTKYIEYPRSLDGQLFQLQPMGSVRTIHYDRPTTIANRASAMRIVGFAPLVPGDFPLGFQVQEVQYDDSRDWKSVVVRLTDGLARATVYQWRLSGSNGPVSALEDSTVMDYKDGVRLMLVSDLSPRVRQRLLEAFVAQASANPWESVPRGLYGLIIQSATDLAQTMELITAASTFAVIDNLDGQG